MKFLLPLLGSHHICEGSPSEIYDIFIPVNFLRDTKHALMGKRYIYMHETLLKT